MTNAEASSGRLLATAVALAIFIVVAALTVAVVDDVGHEDQVLRLRGQRMARGQNGEPKEIEHSQQRGSIRPVLLEAQDDMCALELLLSMFQQSDQALTGALRQDAGRDLHVETLAVHQDRLPDDLYAGHRGHLEAQVDRTILTLRQTEQAHVFTRAWEACDVWGDVVNH